MGSVPSDIDGKVQKNTDDISALNTLTTDLDGRLASVESDVSDLKSKVQAITDKLNADNCQPNPCQNQGSCISLYDSYLCQCNDQWQGPTCASDVDECSKFSPFGLLCHNGGTCVNKPGSFECTCPPEFFGPFCSSQYDDCTDGSAKCVHGICLDNPRDDPSIPKYTCICNDGWDVASDTDPACTKDKDECLEKPCSKNPEVQCYNNPGSYTCGPCPSGFVGDGWACTDINECANNNGGCSLSPYVVCHNSPGSYYCGPCPSGYTGDGFVCTAVDLCSVDNGGCHPMASCTTNPGTSSVVCTCNSGYTGDGYGPSGCTPWDCDSSCANGQCSGASGDLTCVCDPGWSGGNCDVNVNECASSPCQYGGTCNDGINGYTCDCVDGFTGTNCQTQQSGCGAYYRQDSGAFSFPASSGQTYPASSSCAWVIEVTAGKIIQCTFPLFEIESSDDCDNDYLQIHDGDSASAHQIGKYCGTTVPGDPLLSTHNKLYFWFYSNAQNNMKGFQVVWQTTDPECGADITGQTYGDLSSPGYPGDYPINTDCYWTIQVQPGNVVQLLFGALALETHENCSYDFLEVRNGMLETDPVLARYCSSTTPPPLLSTAPAVWIHFHSGPINSDQGFHIVWTSQPVDINGCGGYFDDDDGIIISPNWPNPYESNQECFWQIHIRDSGQIVLDFTDMDIEDHEECTWDFVEVRDGPNEAAPLVGRHCGQEPPPPFTSTANDLWMRFRSDEAQTGAGFRATYTVLCGGTYTASEGQLVSPYYPEVYPANKDCYYVIRQQPGYVVTLIFDDVEIEHEDNCQYDYIEVRDGSSSDSPLLARICGTTIPVPLMSTQNYMWVHLHTDPYVGGGGFKASYTSEYTGCGGVYTEPIGSLQSPGHPSPYPHGANCTYYISVDPAFIINFDFISFSMSDPGSDGACDDFVELFDGPSTGSPSLGRFCGSVPPPATVTNGYQMTIFFSADEDINSEGFAAAYSTINASTACGKRLTDNQGMVMSPNYPANYYDMRTCVWTLNVDPNMQIQVNFTDFVFEGPNAEGTCIYDYLEIRNGGYEDSALIGTYCGTNSPGHFTTHGSQLYMKMYTDPMTNGRGFLMYYDGSLTGCGGTLTSADGYFQSPNYPFAYNHNSECFWLIKVSEGSTIRLTFTTFDIEVHGYCEFDYVEVYDGPTTGYPSLGRQCGSRLPPPYESSDNQLYVQFRSDPFVAGSGFMAQYHVACTRTIESQSSGKIQSLDFPSNYPPNRDCAWTVKGSYGNRVNITFSYFAMETCNDCSCDFVELYDGTDVNESPMIGRFCTGNPGPFRTQSDSFVAVFHTDPYIQAPGFEITWAVDGCGDTLTEPTGTITSPNYPNNYDNNKECIWQINTSPGTSIELTVTVFDVEHHPQCDYDVLEVYNGRYVDSSFLLVRLCNSGSSPHNLPLVVTSTSTFMVVRFLTDDLVNGRGFTSTYKEVPGVCGGQINAPSGTIQSPNYPGNYDQYQDCEWYVDVGEGSTVIVTFVDFDIEPEENCKFDFVAVFDGNQTTDQMLLKACGSSIPDPIQTTGHQMLLQFYSDPYFTHTGFKATFASGCGGKITSAQDGEISSPNYPDSYPADTNCTWTVQSPETDGHITLTFTHMDMYFDPNSDAGCGEDDYIQVLDGTSMTSPPYDRYCRTSLPPPITSLSRAFTVTMVSQSFFQRTGFRALYSASTSRCGGDLTAQSGYFNSPNYPDNYPSNAQCVWTIKSAPGNGISLSFLFFDVESQSNCLFDYVQVREGSEDGDVIMHACGNQLPANLTTINGHILYVIFRSDVSTEGRGFQAAYRHTYGSTTIAEFDGAIASPMYPGLYPDDTDAYYYVYAPSGRLISYSFTLFDLEPPTEEGCVYDYLAIYDGDSTEFGPLLFSCGNDFIPPPRTTTQGAMLVWFHSDWGAHGMGFYMNWVAVMGEGVPPNPTNVPTIAPGACGAEQMVAAVYPIYFVTPGWPGLYPNNLDCIWVIEAAPQHTVMFTFITIDMEAIDDCKFDHVAIYNGPNVTSPSLGRYCGKRVPNNPIYSTGNYMTVLFHSDNSVGYLGFNASYQQGCGGLITSDLGAIESPNYPNEYPPNTVCGWVVISTLSSNITLNFDSQFDIANSDNGNCDGSTGDYLLLRNGRDYDSPPLTPNNGEGNGQYCGSSPPQNLETQANGLFVMFSSGASGSGAGFRFTFTAELGGCGSLLHLTDQVTSATLTSPNYPNTYPSGIDCYWIIEAPATEAVQLDFTEFNVEAHANCEFDYVLVMDGRTGDGEVLGKFCGSTQPPTTKSIGNEMTVRFRSDPYVTAGGFKAIYSLAACGGTVVGVGGSITSPAYPSNYPVSTSCSWVVRGPAYHFLSFDFDSLDLAVTDGAVCGDGTGDYIEFRTYNFTGPLLATVCGNAVPDTIDTITNVVYITFVSDKTDTAGGFSLSYAASEDACGADLNNAGGSISSPNYPNAYDHARTCTWNIVVADDRRVTLEFHAFAIEDPYEDGVCYWDYLEVFNGINPNSPSIRGRVCGSGMPDPFQSSGNTMRVVFATDASISNGGFLATYSSTEPRVCGGLLNSPNGGFFSTPNYPKNYGSATECVWTIDNPNNANSTTLITFLSFAVENHVICDYDYVMFRTGATIDGYPIGTYCGHTTPVPFGIAFPQNFVQFVSDPYVTDTGFNVTYTFTKCGGFIGGTTNGVVTSPNYPDPYDNDDYCLWTIGVVEGHKVNLLFTDFQIEPHNSCQYDYLKLFNGPTVDSPLVDTYCGDNKPTEFQSGTNTVTILFQSDYAVATGGFRVEWSEDGSGCGNVIYHQQSGTINSPNYPNSYPRNSDCIWQMIADPSYHISVTFDENFYIEYDDGCMYDFVALFDGSSEFAPEITRFCGVAGDDTAPGNDPVDTSIQYLTVRFRTDFSSQRTGFKADWQATCGQTITSESGTIQSPNYPSAYNNVEYCEFLITYDDAYKFIMLTFTNFNVEAGSGPGLCDYDYVQVYGGSDKNAPLLGSYCNNLRPSTPLSSEGSMLVVFSTDPATIDYGFRATYESSDCGGMLTASSGAINAFTHSDLHNNRNCTWQIEVSPAERLVEYKFSSFDLESHSGCQYDYVKFYDGINTQAPLIGTYCGRQPPSHILSTGNQLTIEYVTDDLTTGNGFTGAYRTMPGPAEGCGGKLTEATGTFSSPDLDNSGKYDPNLNCVWLIEVDEHSAVTIEFDSFRLENESSAGVCGYDHVDIRDGSSELDPLALKACGVKLPSPFLSSTNQLFVRFDSDPYIEDTGFVARYSTSPITCGGALGAGTSYLPLNSPEVSGLSQALACRWTIDAGTDTSQYLQINFMELNIQSSANQGTDCAVSYVELRDFPLGDYGQVRRYCGSDLPEDFYSLDQVVQVNLRADLGTTGTGFVLQYKSVGCTRKISQPYGQLFSPGWPDPLAANLDCQTRIRVEEGTEIQLFFNFFDVEYEPNCDFDYLEIRQGTTIDDPVIKRLCGNGLPDPVFVQSNEVFIQLITDPYIEGFGYSTSFTLRARVVRPPGIVET